MIKEIKGNLISLAKEGKFDVITHGANCFCTMGAGIAPQMARAFGCDDFKLEGNEYRGDYNKMGQIDYQKVPIMIGEQDEHPHDLYVVNSYTQFGFRPVGRTPAIDYDALRMCMRKIKQAFPDKKIGIPKIGAGLAGGDWSIIYDIIQEEMKGVDLTIVEFK